MEDSSAGGGRLSRLLDKVTEQEWFQSLKTKWDELDPQSRLNAKIGFAGSSIALIAIFLISFLVSVSRLKSELNEKLDLLNTITSASDELKRLKESNSSGPGAGASSTAPWTAYIEGLAATAGIDKATMTIAAERPGKTSEQAKEALLEVTVKHVSIKQVIRFAYAVENSARPVKLRNLNIDTKADPAGFMDATLYMSGFSLVPPKT